MSSRAYIPDIGEDGAPLVARIARAVASDIRRTRLRPNARLPGSRDLAERLGVHRNTVLAAYAELEQEGWIRTEPARGTFVAEVLPDPRPRAFGTLATRPIAPFELSPPPEAPEHPELHSGVLQLVGGLPDVRLFPHAAIARAYRNALRRAPDLLGYGAARGEPQLRAGLLELLASTRSVVATDRELLVTRGSQMALHLAARVLCRPGDTIAVEGFGYRPAWEAMKLAGATLVPVPVDRHGIDLDALSQLASGRRLRAVYVTPHHQYPTTVTMPAPRRLELLALAERHAFAIIEDDYDHEFHWNGRPVLPLASADAAKLVLYVGTLSKVLAPGLRIGYLVARPQVIDHATRLRTFIDRQGDLVVERAIAELLEDGELMRHVRRMRRVYRERRDALAAALERELGERMHLELPAGGLALWARLRGPVSTDRLAAAALDRGVLIHPGSRFSFDRKPHPFLRLGFPALDLAEIARAVRVVALALRSLDRAREKQ